MPAVNLVITLFEHKLQAHVDVEHRVTDLIDARAEFGEDVKRSGDLDAATHEQVVLKTPPR